VFGGWAGLALRLFAGWAGLEVFSQSLPILRAWAGAPAVCAARKPGALRFKGERAAAFHVERLPIPRF
jgi:hypothetical protein